MPLLLEWSLRKVASECPPAILSVPSQRQRWAAASGLRYFPMAAKKPKLRKACIQHALVEWGLSAGEARSLRLPAAVRHSRMSLVKACGLFDESTVASSQDGKMNANQRGIAEFVRRRRRSSINRRRASSCRCSPLTTGGSPPGSPPHGEVAAHRRCSAANSRRRGSASRGRRSSFRAAPAAKRLRCSGSRPRPSPSPRTSSLLERPTPLRNAAAAGGRRASRLGQSPAPFGPLGSAPPLRAASPPMEESCMAMSPDSGAPNRMNSSLCDDLGNDETLGLPAAPSCSDPKPIRDAPNVAEGLRRWMKPGLPLELCSAGEVIQLDCPRHAPLDSWSHGSFFASPHHSPLRATDSSSRGVELEAAMTQAAEELEALEARALSFEHQAATPQSTAPRDASTSRRSVISIGSSSSCDSTVAESPTATATCHPAAGANAECGQTGSRRSLATIPPPPSSWMQIDQATACRASRHAGTVSADSTTASDSEDDLPLSELTRRLFIGA